MRSVSAASWVDYVNTTSFGVGKKTRAGISWWWEAWVYLRGGEERITGDKRNGIVIVVLRIIIGEHHYSSI